VEAAAHSKRVEGEFMNHRNASIVALVAMAGASTAQESKRPSNDPLYLLLRTDRKAFAEEVSRNSSSELGRAKAVVLWLTQHLDWQATDYKKRTVQEIVDRGGGNCDDLARVYGGRLHTLPAWKQWVSLLDQLDDKVKGAFAGTTNLHEYQSQIDSVAATYEELRSEARGLTAQKTDAPAR
jgi:hypothetical protein